MKRSDYRKAAALVGRYYYEVLDDLTEEILETENAKPSVGKDIGTPLESYALRLWHISTILQQLQQVASEPKPKLTQVAKIDCTHENVTFSVSEWLSKNMDADILDVSFVNNVEGLTCIIVFRSSPLAV